MTISIYKRIAMEIERDQTYIYMCKSFPTIYIGKKEVYEIFRQCKKVETIAVDIIIPNWNDYQVECKLRDIVTSKYNNLIISRLLSNLRERLLNYLKSFLYMDIPAVKLHTKFYSRSKIYILQLMYSFMPIEQTISQNTYTHIQKIIGHNSQLLLIIFWISLRYSILYNDINERDIAIRNSSPHFDDIESVLSITRIKNKCYKN